MTDYIYIYRAALLYSFYIDSLMIYMVYCVCLVFILYLVLLLFMFCIRSLYEASVLSFCLFSLTSQTACLCHITLDNIESV